MEESYFASFDAYWLLCIVYNRVVKTLNPYNSTRIYVLAHKKKRKTLVDFHTLFQNVIE